MTIGPFARLRPGTVLADGVHVGNFVETKNATIGVGSKANHLTYLGDAVIGAGVNVGAGTITCNYDGANKFTTTIHDGAFIGSNAALVAPVTIGEGATIAAGSVINKDADAGKLTVARAKQVTVDGWKRPVKNQNDRPLARFDASRSGPRLSALKPLCEPARNVPMASLEQPDLSS